MAEALAVELGLQHVLEMGYPSIVCFFDCLNVVTALQSTAGVTTF